MSKLLTNELYKQYLETVKEKIANGSIVGTKNANGTYTAKVSAFDLDAFCKENDIDFEETLKSVGIKKSVGSYSVNEINAIAKDYTYGTNTSGIQVEAILDEYMRQQIVMCLNPESIHNKLVARSIPVDSQDVRITYQKRVEDASVNLLNVEEGANLPKLNALNFASEVLTLGKVGGEIDFTYEVLKSAKINLLSVHYQAVATNYDLTKDTNIINVLLNGHEVGKTEGGALGSRGGAISTFIPAISVQNILPIIEYFKSYGIELKYAVMNSATLRTILGIEEFSTPLLYNAAITGKLTEFIGLDVIITEKIDEGKILAVDPTKAVEEYVFQTLSSESDKNVHNQTVAKTFWEISGYALVNPNAATVISVDTDADWELPLLKEVN